MLGPLYHMVGHWMVILQNLILADWTQKAADLYLSFANILH